MSDWQPIETAPKDRDSLLSDGTLVSQGGWVTDVSCGAEYEGQLGMAGWWAYEWSGHPDGVVPTHWMPLPEPPGAARQSGALRLDAERYRWLRAQPESVDAPRIDVVYWTVGDESTNEGEGLRLNALDAAIDEAMKVKP